MIIKKIIRRLMETLGIIVPPAPPTTPPEISIYEKVIERRCEEIAKKTIFSSKDMNSEEYSVWLSGLKDELKFWYISIALDGWSWSEAYKLRLNSDYPFQYPKYVSHFSDQTIICLEVGAGALPALGRQGVPGKDIQIIPTDALAMAYEEIFKDFGVRVKFPVRQCEAENLKTMFPTNMFHFAHANNCLDHCYDPLTAIQNMYDLTKPTGRIILAHFINVAISEDYQGLHQWNFSLENGRLIVWNKIIKYFLDEILPKEAEIIINVIEDQNWITAIIRKP